MASRLHPAHGRALSSPRWVPWSHLNEAPRLGGAEQVQPGLGLCTVGGGRESTIGHAGSGLLRGRG